jgi:hypothetical protein
MRQGGTEEGGNRPLEAGLISGGADKTATMTIFGDYRQFGSYMLSLSPHLKTVEQLQINMQMQPLVL